MKLVLTDEAREDLADIGNWVARDNPARAVTFIDEIEAYCLRVAAAPLSYPLLPGYESRKLRRAIYGNYLIIYRIDPSAIVMIRILHGARDYESILFPDE
jgi:toxin ParE1/3/4